MKNEEFIENEELILALKNFNKFIDRKIKKVVSSNTDLGKRSVEVLLLISENTYEPVSQNKLCEIYSVKKSNMVEILDLLEKKDYIFREKNINNRRENLIFPTEKGKKEAQKMQSIFKKEFSILFKDVSKEEIAVILNVTKKITSD